MYRHICGGKKSSKAAYSSKADYGVPQGGTSSRRFFGSSPRLKSLIACQVDDMGTPYMLRPLCAGQKTSVSPSEENKPLKALHGDLRNC